MLRVYQQVGIRVGVRVDETGRDDEPLGIDYSTSLRTDKNVDGLNPLADNADVRLDARCSGTIDDGAVRDD